MKTITLLKGISLGILMTWAMGAQAQWNDAGSYARLNTSADDVHIGSSVNPDAKLRVVDNNTTGETVDFTTTGNLIGGGDLLNLTIGSGSSVDAEIIEANRGGTKVFHLYGNGKIDLRKGATIGRAIEVNGEEALWGNANYFSWGFGKDYNFFGPEVIIGDASVVPSETDGLTLTGNEDLRFEGTGAKYARFTESGALKGLMGHSGINMFLRNYETGGDVYLGANGSTDMTIEDGGEVGIGISSPESKFHIYNGAGTATTSANTLFDMIVEDNDFAYVSLDGADFSGIWMASGTNRYNAGVYKNVSTGDLYFRNGNSNRMTIESNGNVGIGTTSSAYRLQVVGNVDVTGELTAASDMRLKRDVEPIDGALAVIAKLNPVSYNFKTEAFPDMELAERNKMGLLAQEVEEVLPALVSTGSEASGENGESFNVKSVNYVEMIPLLIKSIQELQQENEALRARLDAIEK